MNLIPTITLPVSAVDDMLHCIKVQNEIINTCMLDKEQEQRWEYALSVAETFKNIIKEYKK